MPVKSFSSLPERAILLTIIVAGLGYFVDIFDLLLFSIVRVPSLKDLGLSGDALLREGIVLINVQMAGLLLGGLVWGVMGDRLGRRSVLFGSILLYSAANIANGFTHSITLYAGLRFVAGLGLAGELGAGITLASELLPTAHRGIGTAFIAAVGVLGAALAVTVTKLADWRVAYIFGGCIGILLLLMRVNVRESSLYESLMAETHDAARGSLRILFLRPINLRRFLAVTLVGVPLWGVVGLFMTFTPEFAKAFGMTMLPTAGGAVLACYLGISAGGAAIGLLSQKLRSRRKATAVFQLLTAGATVLYILFPYGDRTGLYYAACGLLGFGCGYWATFVQMAAEQFGTNIRATAATAAPNFVRGATIPITAGFHALIPRLGVAGSGVAVMAVLMILAAGALFSLRETFETDLRYVE